MKKKITSLILFVSSLSPCLNGKIFNFNKPIFKSKKELKIYISELNKEEIKQIEKKELQNFVDNFI